ncbi:6-pyruvoyl-tetrahydropterin synthase-related protein [Pyrococcus abyssi]|uniref:Membrane protein 6-pyruvoyl-tetrahydropterin synthase-related domain-containing protein n=1 Tax=Pyrococcus abyssi (strain GE5 / Orsay) TaxID=272844 RepID=Q9UY38_PYRAB|nr:6-pyruvoyl-tetrahydropterin synthase-related protein [Pyrococcus abyssi]CAB50574.1 Hypothetical protein PAB1095 [Pyrococcus abyssi GE5]CCE71138.1 TPA: hypothetical protein PAB1095 [Pyrococcus abyssi GE5]
MKRKLYYLTLATISVIEYIPLYLAPSPPALQINGNGHLFKVHKLMTSGWKPWIEDWYAGYPFLRFYPPLSYLTAGVLGKVLGSDTKGYAATLMLTSFLGALALHHYLKSTGREPCISPLIFLLFPWHLTVSYIEGNFPRANAIHLAPLFLLSLYWLREKRERYLIASALGISIVALTHYSILPLLIITGILILWDDLRTMTALGNGIKVLGAVIGLTSFWYVPFLFDKKWVEFWNISENKALFKSFSLNPTLLKSPFGILLILLLLIFAIFAIKNLVDRKKVILAGLYLYLSLGFYSPTTWLYSFPLLSIVPPYRWFDLEALIIPLLIGESLKRVQRKSMVALVIIPFTVLAFMNVPKINPYPQDLIKICENIKEEPGDDWRIFVLTDVGEAINSYLPAICKKPTLNGWYHEGSPTKAGERRMIYILTYGGNLTPYLKAYAVRFLITPKEINGYEMVLRIGKYKVYKGDTSFFQPVSVIVMGKYYELPFDFVYIKDTKIISGQPNVVVLYIGQPSKEEESMLWKFIKNGGTVIWVPETKGEFLGIKAEIRAISNDELRSSLFNVSRFSPFSYNHRSWYAPVFSSNIVRPLISVGNYTLIGEVRIGNGTLYLAGGNLIFHALSYKSSYEISIIRALIGNMDKSTIVNYKLLERSDGRLVAEINSTERTLIRVSEAYYPYWKGYINGREVRLFRDYRTGLMIFTFPRNGTLVIEFKDPFLPLRRYSLVGWIILTAYLVIETGKTYKKRYLHSIFEGRR